MNNRVLFDFISQIVLKSSYTPPTEESINWEEIISSTDAQCLLWNFVDEAGIQINSPYKKFVQASGRNLRVKLLNELHILADLFKRNDIPFLVLKGVPMEYVAYQRKVSRDLSDIDIFIPQYAMKPVLKLLLDNGYQLLDNTRKYEAITMDQALKLVTRHIVAAKDDIFVEVHHQFHFSKTDGLLGNQVGLLENFLWFDSHKVILKSEELGNIPTLDVCDSLLLVSNHIFYELESTNDREEDRYPLKLFIDALFLLKRIKEQNLYQELLLRADNRNYSIELNYIKHKLTLLQKMNKT